MSQMIADIEAHFKDSSQYTGCERLLPAIRTALEQVDRSSFLPSDHTSVANQDSPLPIGCGQTISQPFIVALMTQCLATSPNDNVLEVGTGSGYQAAVLSLLVKQVYSLEIIDTLAERARKNLEKLHYKNVTVRCADGYYGWQEQAPFDAIIVTAAATEIPAALVEQLAEGGRLVMPLETGKDFQQLIVGEKQSGGELAISQVLPVRFVPFTRGR